MKTGKEVDKVLEVATNIASKYGHSYISTEHMLLAILKNNQFAKLLIKFGVQLVATPVVQFDVKFGVNVFAKFIVRFGVQFVVKFVVHLSLDLASNVG